MFLPINKIIAVISTFIVFTSCSTPNNNQIAKVNFSLEGDFGQEYSQLTLSKEEKFIRAKLDTKGNQHGSIQTTIDSEGMKVFNAFLNELKQINTSGFCTTVIECKAETSEGTIYKRNIDCNWNGFENLKKALFGIHYEAKYLKPTY